MPANSALESLRDTRIEHSGRDANRQRGRGSYINYYDDLGFSTTDAAHTEWRAKEDQYQAARAKDLETINARKGQISAAEAELNKAQLNLPGLPSIGDAWNKHKESLVPFTVISGGKPTSNNSAYYDKENPDGSYGTPSAPPKSGYSAGDISGYTKEGTYYLPSSVIASLQKSGLHLISDGGGYMIPTNVAGQQVGNKVHDALRGAQLDYYGSFSSQAANEISALKSTYDTATSNFNAQKSAAANQIGSAKADMIAAQERLAGIDQLRNEQMNTLRDRYQTRLNTLRELFTGKKE